MYLGVHAQLGGLPKAFLASWLNAQEGPLAGMDVEMLLKVLLGDQRLVAELAGKLLDAEVE